MSPTLTHPMASKKESFGDETAAYWVLLVKDVVLD